MISAVKIIKVEDASTSAVPQSISNSRGATLNPEASVFLLPDQQQQEQAKGSPTLNGGNDEDDDDGALSFSDESKEHHFMNGDIGKRVCTEHSHTAESLIQKHLEDMSIPAKNDFESVAPMEKMTEASAMPELIHKDTSSNKENDLVENKEIVNGVNKDNENQALQHPPKEDDKKNDTGQNKENEYGSQVSSSVAVSDKGSSSIEPLTKEQIKELLGQNIEYFFSRENWSSDPYLLSQMDSDQYVPVYILANCSQFKSITKNHSIIMEALKDSLFVQLDEEKNRVRPNYKRCIVILREIPKTTPVKDIEAMFEGEGCPKAISCEFVHNDFWYVTFESDSDAQKAYRYLRETVKTFQNKPILARIKTKPMSRLGCLSVLPSYTGKPPNEARENSLASQASGSAGTGVASGNSVSGPGIQGIPSSHPPPNAYATNNPQRMYYPTQSNLNPPYPNYSFTGSAQIPTAYFYPNPMMQWPPPNFYDINSFFQYNGLSPRAAFKPPATSRFNSNSTNNNNNNNNNGNNSRRNKNRDQNRDSKYEKNDSRLLSNGSGGSSQARQNTVNSRPNPSQSPHPSNNSGNSNTSLNHSITSSQTTVTTTTTTPPSHFSKGENQSNLNTCISSGRAVVGNSNSLGVAQTSHNSFAQNDLSLASQSNLYTSFSSPAVSRSSVISVEKTGGMDSISTPVTCAVISVSHLDSYSSKAVTSVTSSLNTATSTSSTSVSTTVSQNFTRSDTMVTTSVTNHTQVPQNSVVNPPVPHNHNHHNYHNNHNNQSMPSHRNSFNNEIHSGRDPQLQRQITRGGRRRVSRRDEEMNGHLGGSGGRGSQRNAGNPCINGDSSQPKSGSHAESKKPSFELQSTSFPPLPSADEVVVPSSEEKCQEPSQSAWSGETHTFSDVMKGTAKPKHATPIPSQIEKEHVESVSSLNNSNDKVNEGSISSTNLSSCESTHVSSLHIVNSNNNSSSSSNNNNNNNNANNGVSKSIADYSQSSSNSNLVRQERTAVSREERRNNTGLHVVRRERDFIPGIGRGRSRRERETGNFRLGNKENRPQTGNRSWREERPDADGWITKAPRDNRAHRDHRYQNQMHSGNHQHNFYENRNSKSQMIVNGEASPPPPPPPPSRSEDVIKLADDKISTGDEQSKHNITTTTTTTTNTDTKLKSEAIDKEKQDNISEGEHKPSWAKMALASKDYMERLATELKEKEEQERLKTKKNKVPQKAPERSNLGRDRDGKPFRRDNFSPRERDREFGEKSRNITTDFKGGSGLSSDKSSTVTGGGGSSGFGKVREALRPKSPK